MGYGSVKHFAPFFHIQQHCCGKFASKNNKKRSFSTYAKRLISYKIHKKTYGNKIDL